MASLDSRRITLDRKDFDSLYTLMMDQVREVAKSAGGFVGLGTISSGELEMIEKIESAFLT